MIARGAWCLQSLLARQQGLYKSYVMSCQECAIQHLGIAEFAVAAAIASWHILLGLLQAEQSIFRHSSAKGYITD